MTRRGARRRGRPAALSFSFGRRTEFPEFEGFWVEKLYDPSGTQIDPDSWNDVVIDNYKYKSLKLYEVALFPLSDGVFDLEPMIMKIETKEKDPSFKRLFWDDPFFDTFSQNWSKLSKKH